MKHTPTSALANKPREETAKDPLVIRNHRPTTRATARKRKVSMVSALLP